MKNLLCTTMYFKNNISNDTVVYQHITVHTHLCRDNDSTEKEQQQTQLEIHAGRWSLKEWHCRSALNLTSHEVSVLWVCGCLWVYVYTSVCEWLTGISAYVGLCNGQKPNHLFLDFKSLNFSLSILRCSKQSLLQFFGPCILLSKYIKMWLSHY